VVFGYLLFMDLLLVLFFGIISLVGSINLHFAPPVDWVTHEHFGYEFSLPVDRLENIEEHQVKYSGKIDRMNSWETGEMCSEEYYVGHVTIREYEVDTFNYRRSDGNAGHLVTVEDVEDYVALKRGEILDQWELDNGSLLLLATGRYGSAPCLGNQYSGFILDGDTGVVWVTLILDEPRTDIVDEFFSSITPVAVD
jgi:hypothetical protein